MIQVWQAARVLVERRRRALLPAGKFDAAADFSPVASTEDRMSAPDPACP